MPYFYTAPGTLSQQLRVIFADSHHSSRIHCAITDNRWSGSTGLVT